MSQTLEHPPWIREAERFLEEHGLDGAVSVAELRDLLASQTALWRTPLPDGRGLYFLKLRVPLTEREEVLAGNLLFSDFVRKCALESLKLEGEALALTGDLDDAYYLVVSGRGADALARSVRENVGRNLADLFFGAENLERGIHGSPENMFSFLSSNREPYPVFAVPMFLSRELYDSVIEVLDRKLGSARLIRTDPKTGSQKPSLELRNIQASVATFFARDGNEMQSMDEFLLRLARRYGALSEEEIREALRPAELSKNSVKEAFKNASFDEDKTRELFAKALQYFKDAKAETAKPEESWFLPNIRRVGKLLSTSFEEYVDCILDGAFMGFTVLGEAERNDRLICRVCGAQTGLIGEKSILLGRSVKKFYNQKANSGKEASSCPRCALFSFLSVKMFGMTTAGENPVPSRENLIFHYGRHSEEGVKRLENMANRIIGLLQELREVRREAFEANKKRKEEEQVSLDADWSTARLRELVASRNYSNGEAVENLLRGFYKDRPLVEQIVSTVRKVNVFSLGAEEQKIVIFALPHFRDELELAQKRFSKNRSTVFSLMAFLSDLCGCDGPFFFQGKPRLEASGSSGVFYIRDRAYAAERYRRRYEALSRFAFNAVGGKPSDALKDRLKLATELEDAPLATFDSVLKASPIRAGQKADEGRYRRAPNEDGRAEYDPKLGVYSPWEYLKFFDELRQLEKEERFG